LSSVETKTPRLLKKYQDEIRTSLKDELGLSNIMAVPKLTKIVINMGCGEAVQNKKYIEDAQYTLAQITGQQPVVTNAKKAISNFKLREGMPIGAMVTLRGNRMWEFLDRLISVTLPREKDFRGVPKKAFDGRGNYSFGLKENLVFMEVNRDKIANIQGLQINICTTAGNNEGAKLMLTKLGMPFRK